MEEVIRPFDIRGFRGEKAVRGARSKVEESACCDCADSRHLRDARADHDRVEGHHHHEGKPCGGRDRETHDLSHDEPHAGEDIGRLHVLQGTAHNVIKSAARMNAVHVFREARHAHDGETEFRESRGHDIFDDKEDVEENGTGTLFEAESEADIAESSNGKQHHARDKKPCRGVSALDNQIAGRDGDNGSYSETKHRGTVCMDQGVTGGFTAGLLLFQFLGTGKGNSLPSV